MYRRPNTHSGVTLCDPKFKIMFFIFFRLSFFSKRIPKFLNFLNILRISPELMLTPLVEHKECM